MHTEGNSTLAARDHELSLGSLQMHAHPCSIYENREQLKQQFVPYLRAGLELGEKCVYFIDENDDNFVLGAMEEDGLDLQHYIRTGQFEVIHTSNAHLDGGHFAEDKMLAYWNQSIESAKKAGFKGLRAAVEMTWALSGMPGCEILAPYESRLTHLMNEKDASVICMYSRRKFTPEKIKAIIHAHPLVVAQGIVLENPACPPPEEFDEGSVNLDIQALLDNLELIRELKQTKRELQQALDAKSKFVSTISHEVRTPMAGVIGLTELLMHKNLGGENNLLVESIFQSGKRMLQLLNNVLDIARLESGNVTLQHRQFSTRKLLYDAVESAGIARIKKDCAIEINCDPNIPKLLCGDELRLRQVLVNLLGNAFKFTERGKIDLTCNCKQQHGDKLFVRFAVQDTGIGISKEDQYNLFKPFSQGSTSIEYQHAGTGLGLSICKELVELMGGGVGVESRLGEGSTFWFEIPFNSSNCH